MSEEKEKCPCAAVAELKVLVEVLTEKVSANEKRIEEGESKLNRDFTSLQLLSKDIQSIAEDMKDIHSEFKEYMTRKSNEESEEQKDTKDRVHKIVDEVIRWGILLLLGYVATRIGLQ